MNLKNILLLLVLVSVSALLNAQIGKKEIFMELQAVESRVKECKKSEGEPCGLYVDVLQANEGSEPWPAVGIYLSETSYWYERAEESDEPQALRLIEIATARSSRLESEVYLFNAEGVLMYYNFKLMEQDIMTELYHFYFDNGKLVLFNEMVAEANESYRAFREESWIEVLKMANEKRQGFLSFH